jgi:adsorption protein B
MQAKPEADCTTVNHTIACARDFRGGAPVEFGGFTLLEWLAMAEHELLLFAGIFFLIGGLDELLMDLSWLWLRLSGRAPTPGICRARTREAPLKGGAAVLIPAWHEAPVLATTVAHACAAWPQRD